MRKASNPGGVGPGASADDRALVAAAQRRDPDAWEALYRRNYPSLVSLARRRLQPAASAEDAVSETMLRAFKGIDSFSWEGASFDAWLHGILRNVLFEAHRRSGRDRSGVAVDVRAEIVVDPADAVSRADDQVMVRRAFDRLESDDREILELRVVAGLSADGVAHVVGSTAGAVRMAQSRALARLRVHYGAVTRDPE